VQKILVAALLAAFARLELTAGSQEPAPVFKSSVAVVPISAVVHDRHGRRVTSLTATDFEVLDKGERRRILDFQTDHSAPITMAVLMDTSGSMRMPAKSTCALEVVKYLSAGLEDGRDEVSLFTFDESLHERQPFTVHPAAIESAASSAEPFGVTSLYDAVAETARRLSTRPSPRRAIIVLTDGLDTSSASTAAQVSGLASSIDVPVYVVATVPAIDREIYLDRASARQTSTDLRDLATQTGGELFWVTSQQEAVRQAGQIVAELRHQYLITIESASEPEWRPIVIRMRDRRLAVRARSGYFSRDDNQVPK
jgi:Ca-activated chloride channel family protein